MCACHGLMAPGEQTADAASLTRGWGTQVWVNAMSKTSDTNVDRKRVDGKILLKDNDLIEIGQRQFIFHSLHPDAAPGSAKVPVFVPPAVPTSPLATCSNARRFWRPTAPALWVGGRI